jgi:hypothetical protein
MALYVDVGSFTLNAATGNQTISFTPVGGVSYTPVLVEFWTVNVTGDGLSVGGAAYKYGYGAAVSSSSRFSVYLVGNDNVSSGGHHRRHDNTKCLCTVTNAGAVFTAADFVSFGSNQFTINVTTANASQRVFHYRVWGGADISNVAIGTAVIPASTGVENTFSGLGFTPTYARLVSILDTTAPPALPAGVNFCMGITDGVHSIGISQNIVSASNANCNVLTSALFGSLDGSNNLDNEALFSSFGSGTLGLNWLDTTNAGSYIFGIFMRGPSFHVNSTVLRTTAGTQTLSNITNNGTSGTSFTPKTLGIISAGETSGSIKTDAARISFGAGVSNAARASTWSGSKDASSPTIADNIEETDHILTIGREGTPTIDVNVDLDSFGSGSAQLDVETTDGTAYFFVYEAAGDAVSGGGGGGSNNGAAAGLLASLIDD